MPICKMGDHFAAPHLFRQPPCASHKQEICTPCVQASLAKSIACENIEKISCVECGKVLDGNEIQERASAGSYKQ